MSNTLTHPIVPADAPALVSPSRSSWRRWPKLILLLLVFLWFANATISFSIQHTAVNRKITARLESAFGRSVEVGSYSFSLWGRPTLEARSVVVGEDPRFGREYFLRAESLTMSVRWLSLLHGHLDFGTISLSRPSLNLVRNPDGDWNLAEWLPRFSPALMPGSGSAIANPAISPATGASTALRFSRIEVDSGRINFKRADEKLPFAFVGVTGYLEPAGPGQWQMDLEAVPARAAVIIQQAGTLHLSGHVGGTSSRLRPAALDLAWTGASISDVLRLVRETDYGVRGNLAVALNARTDAQDWLLQGRAEIRQVHRWDLPLRLDNPSLNLIAKGTLDPESARFNLAAATLETPRSNARSAGSLSWDQPTHASPKDAAQPAMQIASDGIDMSDVLAWVRAFRPGISDDLALRGNAKLALAVGGWPPRISDAAVSVSGSDLTGRTLPVPVRLGPLSLGYDSKGASLQPATISFGAAGGALHIESTGSMGAPSLPRITNSKAAPILHVAGNLTDVGDLISAARLLGWDISHGWDLRGPLRCDLKWQSAPYPWRAAPVGTLDFGSEPAIETGKLAGKSTGKVAEKSSGELLGKLAGDTLRAPFLNLPIEQIRAHLDLKQTSRHLVLASAEAFGARWSGTLDRLGPILNPAGDLSRNSAGAQPGGWQFVLSADRLAAADLDRWLNPRWSESFLDRVLPFLNSRPTAPAQPDNLVAGGKILIDQFALAPLSLRQLHADAAIDGRRISLTNAHAQLSKGDLAGSFRADLNATPSYRLNLDFTGVDLYALTSAAPSLADRFAGSASGKIAIVARGSTRADLLSSFQCRGAAQITGAELLTISLAESFAAGALRPGKSTFREASADFTCAANKIEFQHLLFSAPTTQFAAEGTIDFSRNLDLHFITFPDAEAPRTNRTADSRADAYRLSGNLSDPQITRLNSASTHP
ncbi:MAG: AsmA-like C-terminal region-containing protein [Candidatus Acidiferrales bacterium]